MIVNYCHPTSKCLPDKSDEEEHILCFKDINIVKRFDVQQNNSIITK